MELTRMQLTHTAGRGGREWECALCGRLGYTLDRIDHEASCLLADPTVTSVTSVTMAARRDQIELRYMNNRWWWRSSSGCEYYVERMATTVEFPLGRHCLFGASGLIESKLRLSDIKQWIEQNQGRL